MHYVGQQKDYYIKTYGLEQEATFTWITYVSEKKYKLKILERKAFKSQQTMAEIWAPGVLQRAWIPGSWLPFWGEQELQAAFACASVH